MDKIGQLTAYDNAIGFANAFRCLLQKSSFQALMTSGSYNDASMIMPTIVNGAFACELFLKALINKNTRTHSIIQLLDQFESEQPGIKKYIEKNCVQHMVNKKRNLGFNSEKYQNDLNAIDISFEVLRYWHEPVKGNNRRKDTVYSLDFLEVFVAVLQGICIAKYGNRPLGQVYGS